MQYAPNGTRVSRLAGYAGLASVYLTRRQRIRQRKLKAEGQVGLSALLGGISNPFL